MNKERIYLVGQISIVNKYTYLWRKEVREYFKQSSSLNYNFEIIDPCYNEWNLQHSGFTNDGTTKRIDAYKLAGTNLIVPKDYSYVLKSNGCIANLNQYDPDKPIIGSLFELAWYYQRPEKFVVGVFAGDWTADKVCSHPFVRETVDVWCKDHLEASELIKKYFYLYEGSN